MKRFLERHVNALGFWGVLALVACALVFAAAMVLGRLP